MKLKKTKLLFNFCNWFFKKPINFSKDKFFLKDNKYCSYATNIGIIRKTNQDYVIAGTNKKNVKIMLICDGIGGSYGGEIASKITGNFFIHHAQKEAFNRMHSTAKYNWFKKKLFLCQKELKKFIEKNPEFSSMATTFIFAIIEKNKLTAFNIGDSRLYIWKNSQLFQLSTDHNYENFLIKNNISLSGKSAEELNSVVKSIHASRNKKINFEFIEYPLITNEEYILLTTDGLHNFINKDEWKESLSKQQNLKQKVISLIYKGIANNSNDNLSIALCKIKN